MTDPLLEYRRRLAASEEENRLLARRSAHLSVARAVTALVTVVVAWLATESALIHDLWMALPVLFFGALVVHHRAVVKAEARARRRAAHYRAGLARLGHRWAGSGISGAAFAPSDHAYAADLDLFGQGSLFELLCTARTAIGQETLAAWLLSAAAPNEVRRRQVAVQELAPEVDLREELALLGEQGASELDVEGLLEWANAAPTPRRPLAHLAAFALPILLGLSLIGWLALGSGAGPFLLVATLHTAFAFRQQGWVRRVTGGVRQPADELALLTQVLRRVETRRFEAPLLRGLSAGLEAGRRASSAAIRHLEQLIHLLDSQLNMIFAPFAAFLMWRVHLAFALEAWRRGHGEAVTTWVAAVGEFEALTALANFAYENPDDPFPVITDTGDEITTEGLAHPLLPAIRVVRNDLVLGGAIRALVVSGSNMSGKSTLLRALGANVVLALAGAPVRAQSLSLPPLAIGASIRKGDSLIDGRSGFFAEATRLRQIAEACEGDSLVLFLLDEIFHGTNSHDRRIGAEQVVKRLLTAGAIGLVTTHDLALAELEEALAPEVGNVHLSDQVVDGEMTFDYRLRAGPVRRGNALRLLRAVGLIDQPL